jgi:hypothetical protein
MGGYTTELQAGAGTVIRASMAAFLVGSTRVAGQGEPEGRRSSVGPHLCAPMVRCSLGRAGQRGPSERTRRRSSRCALPSTQTMSVPRRREWWARSKAPSAFESIRRRAPCPWLQVREADVPRRELRSARTASRVRSLGARRRSDTAARWWQAQQGRGAGDAPGKKRRARTAERRRSLGC